MKIITDERCAGLFALRPSRTSRAHHPAPIARLKSQAELPIEWIVPGTVNDAQIFRAHPPEMLARLKIPRDFDADTPAYEDITNYARASVAAALDAMQIGRNGENVFSLMRPPDHHATRRAINGFLLFEQCRHRRAGSSGDRDQTHRRF